MSSNKSYRFDSNLTPVRIRVIGVGECGINLIKSMTHDDTKRAEFITADAYTSSELKDTTHRKIQLRSVSRMDGSAESAFYDAENAEEDIRNAIHNTSLLFVCAGMAGTTGAEAAPVIARIARQMGIVTVGVAIMPFDWEGGRRMKIAISSLAKLTANTDAVIELSNERMVNDLDYCSVDDAFVSANILVKSVLSFITDAFDERLEDLKFEGESQFVGASYKLMTGSNQRLTSVGIHGLRKTLFALCNESNKTG